MVINQSEESKDETWIKNWSTATYRHSNIQYKVENDWKMAYLARTSSERAFIEWLFALDSSQDLPFKLELKFETKCFESGQIKLVMEFINGDGSSREVVLSGESGQSADGVIIWKMVNGRFSFELGTGKALKEIKLRAEMSLGNGDNAWQHTQLFRQSLKDTDSYLFDIVFQY